VAGCMVAIETIPIITSPRMNMEVVVGASARTNQSNRSVISRNNSTQEVPPTQWRIEKNWSKSNDIDSRWGL